MYLRFAGRIACQPPSSSRSQASCYLCAPVFLSASRFVDVHRSSFERVRSAPSTSKALRTSRRAMKDETQQAHRSCRKSFAVPRWKKESFFETYEHEEAHVGSIHMRPFAAVVVTSSSHPSSNDGCHVAGATPLLHASFGVLEASNCTSPSRARVSTSSSFDGTKERSSCACPSTVDAHSRRTNRNKRTSKTFERIHRDERRLSSMGDGVE